MTHEALLILIWAACVVAYVTLVIATRPKRKAHDLAPHLPAWAARKRRR